MADVNVIQQLGDDALTASRNSPAEQDLSHRIVLCIDEQAVVQSGVPGPVAWASVVQVLRHFTVIAEAQMASVGLSAIEVGFVLARHSDGPGSAAAMGLSLRPRQHDEGRADLHSLLEAWLESEVDRAAQGGPAGESATRRCSSARMVQCGAAALRFLPEARCSHIVLLTDCSGPWSIEDDAYDSEVMCLCRDGATLSVIDIAQHVAGRFGYVHDPSVFVPAIQRSGGFYHVSRAFLDGLAIAPVRHLLRRHGSGGAAESVIEFDPTGRLVLSVSEVLACCETSVQILSYSVKAARHSQLAAIRRSEGFLWSSEKGAFLLCFPPGLVLEYRIAEGAPLHASVSVSTTWDEYGTATAFAREIQKCDYAFDDLCTHTQRLCIAALAGQTPSVSEEHLPGGPGSLSAEMLSKLAPSAWSRFMSCRTTTVHLPDDKGREIVYGALREVAALPLRHGSARVQLYSAVVPLNGKGGPSRCTEATVGLVAIHQHTPHLATVRTGLLLGIEEDRECSPLAALHARIRHLQVNSLAKGTLYLLDESMHDWCMSSDDRSAAGFLRERRVRWLLGSESACAAAFQAVKASAAGYDVAQSDDNVLDLISTRRTGVDKDAANAVYQLSYHREENRCAMSVTLRTAPGGFSIAEEHEERWQAIVTSDHRKMETLNTYYTLDTLCKDSRDGQLRVAVGDDFRVVECRLASVINAAQAVKLNLQCLSSSPAALDRDLQLMSRNTDLIDRVGRHLFKRVPKQLTGDKDSEWWVMRDRLGNFVLLRMPELRSWAESNLHDALLTCELFAIAAASLLEKNVKVTENQLARSCREVANKLLGIHRRNFFEVAHENCISGAYPLLENDMAELLSSCESQTVESRLDISDGLFSRSKKDIIVASREEWLSSMIRSGLAVDIKDCHLYALRQYERHLPSRGLELVESDVRGDRPFQLFTQRSLAGSTLRQDGTFLISFEVREDSLGVTVYGAPQGSVCGDLDTADETSRGADDDSDESEDEMPATDASSVAPSPPPGGDLQAACGALSDELSLALSQSTLFLALERRRTLSLLETVIVHFRRLLEVEGFCTRSIVRVRLIRSASLPTSLLADRGDDRQLEISRALFEEELQAAGHRPVGFRKAHDVLFVEKDGGGPADLPYWALVEIGDLLPVEQGSEAMLGLDEKDLEEVTCDVAVSLLVQPGQDWDAKRGDIEEEIALAISECAWSCNQKILLLDLHYSRYASALLVGDADADVEPMYACPLQYTRGFEIVVRMSPKVIAKRVQTHKLLHPLAAHTYDNELSSLAHDREPLYVHMDGDRKLCYFALTAAAEGSAVVFEVWAPEAIEESTLELLGTLVHCAINDVVMDHVMTALARNARFLSSDGSEQFVRQNTSTAQCFGEFPDLIEDAHAFLRYCIQNMIQSKSFYQPDRADDEDGVMKLLYNSKSFESLNRKTSSQTSIGKTLQNEAGAGVAWVELTLMGKDQPVTRGLSRMNFRSEHTGLRGLLVRLECSEGLSVDKMLEWMKLILLQTALDMSAEARASSVPPGRDLDAALELALKEHGDVENLSLSQLERTAPVAPWCLWTVAREAAAKLRSMVGVASLAVHDSDAAPERLWVSLLLDQRDGGGCPYMLYQQRILCASMSIGFGQHAGLRVRAIMLNADPNMRRDLEALLSDVLEAGLQEHRRRKGELLAPSALRPAVLGRSDASVEELIEALVRPGSKAVVADLLAALRRRSTVCHSRALALGAPAEDVIAYLVARIRGVRLVGEGRVLIGTLKRCLWSLRADDGACSVSVLSFDESSEARREGAAFMQRFQQRLRAMHAQDDFLRFTEGRDEEDEAGGEPAGGAGPP